ncbi:MAG TPA: tetratricopeptide repeat-containing protein, partial [Pyrinomonadaceae bacterium]
MQETATPYALEASRILDHVAKSRNGGQNGNGDGCVQAKPLDGAHLKKVEQGASREGRGELAREMRRLRIEADGKQAERILGGIAATPAEMLKLAKRLAEYKKFGLARRVLRRARLQSNLTPSADIYVEVYQKSALYTYKDPDLPLEWRLQRALEILSALEDLSKTRNQETLGLAGAIHTRMWQVGGQRKHLWRALGFYLRGYEQGAPTEAHGQLFTYLRRNPECVFEPNDDRGYTGINTAFVLDMLAREEEEDADSVGLVSEAAKDKREFARLIRREIVRSVSPLAGNPGGEWLAGEWWYYATVGEAHFGLGQYEEAVEWLTAQPGAAGLKIAVGETTPAGLEVPEWEFETTARQLGALARLTRPRREPAMSDEEFCRHTADEFRKAQAALKVILGGDEKAVASAFRGKFGLGLSGGGFRASLYHIGVLAKLAELDVLRHVEVLSCVS